MSKREVGIEEARKDLGNLVDRVRYTNQTITLTRHGKPAARIVPLEDTMTTTTSYGTWVNHGDSTRREVEATVEDTLGEYAADHDMAAIVRDYRDAINEALPAEVSLCGNDFIGPYQAKADLIAGYPTDEDGELDIAAIVQSVDLMPIIERHARH